MAPDALNFLTDFADQAVILPLAAAVAGVLCMQRRWRVVGAWALSISGVLGSVLLLKVALYACGALLPAFGQEGIHSPSGHAASAGVTYAGITALQTASTRWPPFPTALAAALLVGTAVGATRIALGAHSLGEVVIATGIGTTGAYAFPVIAGRSLQAKPGWPVLAAAGLVVLLAHGLHLPAEAAIQAAGSGWVRAMFSACAPL